MTAKPGIKLIWHIDLDSFFVSAERLRRPELAGRRVAIAGVGPRAVISSCSYEARKLGVRSAMSSLQALRLCPDLLFVPPDHQHYSSLSKQVFALIGRFAPVFEAVSIDEGYLDMTGTENLFGPPTEAAQALRARIRAATGLTASIGMATNRLVAKIATDHCKPDGILFVKPGDEARFLAPLGVEKLPGCGKVTQAWLGTHAIKTIAELQRYPKPLLERHLGRFGHYLHESAWGRGNTDFFVESRTRSISRERTFEEDLDDPAKLDQHLWEMATEIAQSLRERERAQEEVAFATTIRLKMRYPPFHTVARMRAIEKPTQVSDDLYRSVKALFEEHWDRSALRLLGMGCVFGGSTHQLALFEDVRKDLRREQLERLQDDLRKKFGAHALRRGRDFHS